MSLSSDEKFEVEVVHQLTEKKSLKNKKPQELPVASRRSVYILLPT